MNVLYFHNYQKCWPRVITDKSLLDNPHAVQVATLAKPLLLALLPYA